MKHQSFRRLWLIFCSFDQWLKESEQPIYASHNTEMYVLPTYYDVAKTSSQW